MRRNLVWIAMALATLVFASLSVTAAPLQASKRPDGSYQVADNWNDRVCCKRGWQDWWTTRGACKRQGGYQTRNKDCREDFNDKWDLRWWGWTGGNWNNRVCCKRGNRDWWSTARECRNAFGYITSNRECRNDSGDWNDGGGGGWNDRVCCKRGWQDWWTTRGACQRQGGQQVRNQQCRDDWNDKWDNRWWGWQGGDWNNRVCCKRGNSDWWTSARECRNSFGYITTNRECRNDNNNGGNWPGNNGNWPGNNGNNGNWPGNDNGPGEGGGWSSQDQQTWGSNPNNRVCCKRGYRDWWTSARECRDAGGGLARNDECRND